MKKLRFLCIAPYEGLYHLMNNIAAQRSDVELVIHNGNMEAGLRAVRESQNENFDAIISRGGTVDTIRQHVSIPVCDIAPSVYDVLRTIRLAQGTGENFAVVGFPSITKPAEMLNEIMQFQIPICTIRSAQESKEAISSLQQKGIRIIVGDMLSTNSAQEMGMHGLLIVSGMESIETAIENAISICQHYSLLEKQRALLQELLQKRPERFLLYSADKQVLYSTAGNLPADLMEQMEQRISLVLSRSAVKLSRRIKNEVFDIQGSILSSGGEDYCLYTIVQGVSSQPDKHHIRYYDSGTFATDALFQAGNPLEYYLGNNAAAEKLRNLCNQYASLNAPVLIEGEYGTGKDRFASYVHSKSPLRYSSFVVADVGRMDEKDWDFLLESEQSPLTDVGLTVYLRHLNAAEESFQTRFLSYLQNSNTLNSNRFIFSFSDELGSYKSNRLYLYLSESVHCLRLCLPPLSQRREDIPTLVSLYINATNVRFGTKVIGVTPEAMLLLQNKSWPHNVDQLVKCIQDLVMNADSSYISENQVRRITEKDESSLLSSAAMPDLNRTLEEITRDIVLRVYELEGQNQTKTAQHLNISRSTLWRMLK